MKWILGIFGALIAVAIAVLVYVYLNLGAIIKLGVETYAPDILDVPVTVDSVRMSPFSGQGGINNFDIANPQGFGDTKAIGLGELDLDIDTKSLASDTIIINRVAVSAPEINFFQLDAKRNNFYELLQNIKRNTPAAESTTDEADPAPEATSEQKKLIIDELSITDVIITASSPLLKDKTFKLPVPDIQLNGLGRANGGAYPADLATEIGEKLLAEIRSAITNSDVYKEQLEAAAREKLEAEKARAEAKLKAKQQELEEEAKQKLDDALGENADLLKGLFN